MELPEEKKWRKKLAWVGLVVCVGLLVFLLWDLDFAEFWEALRAISWRAWVGIFVLNALANIFQGLRFHFLVSPFVALSSAAKQIGLQFVANTANIVMPFRSGELVRPLILKTWNQSARMQDLLAWTVFDKILEAVTFLPFLVAAVIWFGFSWKWAMAIALVGLLAIGISKKYWAKTPSYGALVRAGLCSFGMWFSMWAVFGVMVNGFEISLGLLASTTLSSAIPAGPAGVGTLEAAVSWFLQTFASMTAEKALALALTVHASLILSTLLVGLPLLFVWGWPNRHPEMVARIKMPFKYKVSNVFVYISSVVMIVTAGAFWVPSSRMPVKARKKIGEEKEIR